MRGAPGPQTRGSGGLRTSTMHPTDPPRPHRRTALRAGRRVLASAAVALLAGGFAVAGAAPDPVAGAEERLRAATASRVVAEARLAQLLGERAQLENAMKDLSGDSVSIAGSLADARRLARERAVHAYTTAGSAERLVGVLNSAGPTDASIRTVILTAGTQDAVDAAEAYQRLKDENEPKLVALGERIERIEHEIETAQNDLVQASAHEADAERAVVDARRAKAAAVQAAAARAAAPKPQPVPAAVPRPVAAQAAAPAPVEAPRPSMAGSGPTDEQWARLRQCESSGNYRAVSPSGRYRGAYQFDLRTWESVGGTGDPAAAPPEEQDLRARILYERRGARAWPHCGRHLRG